MQRKNTNLKMNGFFAFAVLLSVVACGTFGLGVPMAHIIGTSAAAASLTGIVWVAMAWGWRGVFNAFAGRDSESAKKLIFTQMATTAIGVLLGWNVLLNNLENPDMLGPGVSASFIVVIYSVLIVTYLALRNRLTSQLRNISLFYGGTFFAKFGMTMFIVFVILKH